jgi:hypothetical protein
MRRHDRRPGLRGRPAALGLTLLLSACRDASPVAQAEPTALAPSASAVAPLPTASATASIGAAPAPLPEMPRALGGPAVEATIVDANVIVRDAQGNSARLTELRRDSNAKLSPDGLRVLFLRSVKPGDPSARRRDVMLIGVDGGEPRTLVADDPTKNLAGKPMTDGSTAMTGLELGGFFPDGKRAALSADDFTRQYVLSVDLASGATKELNESWAHDFFIVPKGPYAGDLLLYRMLRGRPGGSVSECWLVDGHTGRDKLQLTGTLGHCADRPDMRAKLKY